jgi:hypothetical protein
MILVFGKSSNNRAYVHSCNTMHGAEKAVDYLIYKLNAGEALVVNPNMEEKYMRYHWVDGGPDQGIWVEAIPPEHPLVVELLSVNYLTPKQLIALGKEN